MENSDDVKDNEEEEIMFHFLYIVNKQLTFNVLYYTIQPISVNSEVSF